MIENRDSLEFLQSRKDFEFDINYSDAPYNLGSELCILPNGKLDYKRKGDFMNKWEALGGEWWEKWFEESFRTLKHGGYCLMFSIDRQTTLFEYYALKAGFQINKQKIYWYFISNFPKSTDLSRSLDRHFGEEREIVGQKEPFGREGRKNGNFHENGNIDIFKRFTEIDNGIGSNLQNITLPSHPLAAKYNGYKYGIAPLKQMCEVVLVFQKPYKTGSCLHDTLCYENGDNECICGALDIDRNRVGTGDKTLRLKAIDSKESVRNSYANIKIKEETGGHENGRFPTQMFIDSETAKILDRQSGILTGSKSGYNNEISEQGNVPINKNIKSGVHFGDTGGCSKSLHICDYENNEMDLFLYSPKVQAKEREKGTEGLEKTSKHTMSGGKKEGEVDATSEKFRSEPTGNNHPTLKPIKLNERILRLFKTPNPQKIVYPFAGVNSEVIGGFRAGFTGFCGCEINSEYVEIGKKRFEYFTLQKTVNVEEKEVKENTQTTLF